MTHQFSPATPALPPEPSDELIAEFKRAAANPPTLHALVAKLLTLRSYSLSANPAMDNQARAGLGLIIDQVTILLMLVAANKSEEVVLKAQMVEGVTPSFAEHKAFGKMILAAMIDDVDRGDCARVAFNFEHIKPDPDSFDA
ncbi:MAG: hypothetical protein CFE31_19435 [Rhizobiales bacterium PAR1]|nr:MAG: hypothetical protein CFE31_19435 [Rhizobiales bacterium PAR1]